SSGRPGPVVIGLTEDVLRENGGPVYPAAPVTQVSLPEIALKHLESEVSASQRPVIVVGGEGWDEASRTRLTAWANARRIPVASDFRAQDIIDNEADCWAGQLGYGRSPRLAGLLGEADLVLYVGAVRSDVLSDGYTLAGDARTIV